MQILSGSDSEGLGIVGQIRIQVVQEREAAEVAPLLPVEISPQAFAWLNEGSGEANEESLREALRQAFVAIAEASDYIPKDSEADRQATTAVSMIFALGCGPPTQDGG